jgi:hypothetical protein
MVGLLAEGFMVFGFHDATLPGRLPKCQPDLATLQTVVDASVGALFVQ